MRLDERIMALILGMVLSACGSATYQPTEDALFDQADFPVGVGVDNRGRFSDGSRFGALAFHHFGRITPGNALKMDALRPAEDVYDFDEAERFVTLCEREGKPVWGHTLVWHLQTPTWLLNFNGSAEDWRVLLSDHIASTAGHFQGRVMAWDVVNEAFEDDGRLRDSPWRSHLGDDHLADAFRWARQADPDAALFYNDYGIPFHPAKLQAVLNMVDDFQTRQPPVPIDGVGLQMHVTDTEPSIEAIRHVLNELSARDLQVHFSELDVSMNINGLHPTWTPELAERQRQRFSDIVRVYRELPSHLQAGITIWGIGDGDSWIRYFFNRLDWPLLFDEDYEPKPAFFGFAEGLAD